VNEFVERFRTKTDERTARLSFPEMTARETPIWTGSPSFLSMAGHYVLALLILLLHLLFYWAGEGRPVNGEADSKETLRLLKGILDVLGVVGFIIILFSLAKINHYLNFATSNKWTTSWMIINGAIPLLIVSGNILQNILGSNFERFLDFPDWKETYYLVLGFMSSGIMMILTLHYQRSFRYAITDRRIHIRKQFLYLDTSAHGISFENIENLKVNPSLIGKILDFGNVHMVTASGIGLREDKSGIGAGFGADAGSISSVGGRTIFRSLFVWITAQRERKTVDQDPEDCLFGIRSPMDIYRLINELSDN